MRHGTNLETFIKALQKGDYATAMKLCKIVAEEEMGVCGKGLCPYREECENTTSWDCKLSDEEEFKIWLGLECNLEED